MATSDHKTAKVALLRIERWPAKDREQWLASLSASDPFADVADRSHLRPISNAKVEKGYGRWLSFLARSRPELLAEEAGTRITPETVSAYVAELRACGNGDQTVMNRLQELHTMATTIVPAGAFGFIRKIEAKLRTVAKPIRSKRDKIIPSDELFSLGCSLMESATALATPRLQALQFRDGLIIAFLALRPLRRKNLTELTLGQSLMCEQGSWFLLLSADETKTHQRFERAWPEELVTALETYLSVHRPVLMAQTGRWTSPVGERLWVSSEGSPQTEMSIYQQIRLRTKAAFGQGVNPHRFRDSAATTLAIEDPAQVRVSARILGHRSFQTTERYYQHAEQNQAHRAFVAGLQKLRIKR
jgi:integrase/recombinase XerD